jgi:hypothetical protein
MNRRENNSSPANSWLGMKLFFVGLLLAAPALLIYILNNHQNSFLGSLSISLFAFGFVFGCVGMVFHWKSFPSRQPKTTKEIRETDETYTIKQPWD